MKAGGGTARRFFAEGVVWWCAGPAGNPASGFGAGFALPLRREFG